MGPNVHSKEENIQEKKIVAIIDKARYQLEFQNKGTKIIIIVVINHIQFSEAYVYY